MDPEYVLANSPTKEKGNDIYIKIVIVSALYYLQYLLKAKLCDVQKYRSKNRSQPTSKLAFWGH